MHKRKIKSLSITSKITIGATFLMLLNALIVIIIAGFLSESLLLGVSVEDLDDLVEAATGQIHIRDNAINYGEGFSFVKDNVYMLVLEEDGMVVAGRYPVNSAVEIGPPVEGFRTVSLPSGDFYVVDKPVPGSRNKDSLWIRAVESVVNAQNIGRFLLKLLLIIMPVFVVLSGILSFIMAKRSLSPVKKILNTVDTIKDAKDLSGRINMPPGNDEIHRLSESFDNMFERLWESFERERQFTADVSHELRTPLSVIKAQCDYLQNYCDDPGEHAEGISLIKSQAEKMSKMAETMLTLSRMEAGSDSQKLSPINLRKLLDVIISGQRLSHPDFIITEVFSKDVSRADSPEEIIVSGNDLLLSLAIENILENAYKYGNKEACISLYKKNDQVIISCKDMGDGIPSENMENIWHRFFRGDASRSSESGQGLGLPLVKRCVSLLGGRVWVENSQEAGAIFYISFP